jgi:hypothetical protein
MQAMPSPRNFWPADRSLFRKRSRGGLGVAAACLVASLTLVAVSIWPA